MGREVKRVPLDFDHPVGEAWPGYLNDQFVECSVCKGESRTKAGEHLARALSEFLNPRPKVPGWDELTAGLCGRKPDGWVGHDACDRYVLEGKLIELAGLPKGWGWCSHCAGDGCDPSAKEAWEAWTPNEPPEGDGWQMWENTSDGSPISPVFATPEELARWLDDTGASAFGSMTASYESWLSMIRGPGYSASCVAGGGKGLRSGVEAVSEAETAE